MGLEGKAIHTASTGWVPVYPTQDQRLAVMSIGFLLHSRDDAVIWRGPKKSAIIKQFLDEVVWGTLDYLVIDTPPGTSDEHLSTVEKLLPYNPTSIIVTTPQGVSLSDVMKEITFCRRVGLPMIGLIENMSGFACPHCAECTNIFGSGGGKALAEAENIPFLGQLPIDPKIMLNLDSDKPFIEKYKAATTLQPLKDFVDRLKQSQPQPRATSTEIAMETNATSTDTAMETNATSTETAMETNTTSTDTAMETNATSTDTAMETNATSQQSNGQ